MVDSENSLDSFSSSHEKNIKDEKGNKSEYNDKKDNYDNQIIDLAKSLKPKSILNKKYLCPHCSSLSNSATNRKPYNLSCNDCGKRFIDTTASFIFILLKEILFITKMNESLIKNKESTRKTTEFTDNQIDAILTGVFPFKFKKLIFAYFTGFK
ncbi:hypothetical protein DMUE_4429, partial [Dictyocoela muelleri]